MSVFHLCHSELTRSLAEKSLKNIKNEKDYQNFGNLYSFGGLNFNKYSL